MNAKNLLKPKIKSVYKLDPTSHRFRICPNDGEEFMADNLNRKFCDDKCADEFHNGLKRDEGNKLLEEAKAIIENASAPLQPNKPDIPIDAPKKNVTILDTLTIDSVKGSEFNLDWLYSLGVDLTAYNGRGVLHNIDSSYNSHFIQIGNYRLFRVEFSQVLIKKII
jgi:hypothetical protein